MIFFKKIFVILNICGIIYLSVDLCGCSSTVELQPSKLITWVRLPSSAPFINFVELIDVFILFKNILQKNLKYHNDRNYKNLITDKKHRVIFNTLRTINKSEINKALSSINREMDEAAEEFYKSEKEKDDGLLL